MPRPKAAVPSYRLQKATGQAVVTTPGENGQRHAESYVLFAEPNFDATCLEEIVKFLRGPWPIIARVAEKDVPTASIMRNESVLSSHPSNSS